MALDLVELAVVERAALGQDRHRHRDLADVVQQAADRGEGDVGPVEAGCVRERECDPGDACRVLGIGRDLRIEPASELEQPRQIERVSHLLSEYEAAARTPLPRPGERAASPIRRAATVREQMKHTPPTQPVALVEIPKGSRNKYEYDEGFGRVMLDRTLRSSLVYPCDYGFMLDTLGGDGDPLDVLVLVAARRSRAA